jgi:hypothetical protein
MPPPLMMLLFPQRERERERERESKYDALPTERERTLKMVLDLIADTMQHPGLCIYKAREAEQGCTMSSHG